MPLSARRKAHSRPHRHATPRPAPQPPGAARAAHPQSPGPVRRRPGCRGHGGPQSAIGRKVSAGARGVCGEPPAGGTGRADPGGPPTSAGVQLGGCLRAVPVEAPVTSLLPRQKLRPRQASDGSAVTRRGGWGGAGAQGCSGAVGLCQVWAGRCCQSVWPSRACVLRVTSPCRSLCAPSPGAKGQGDRLTTR